MKDRLALVNAEINLVFVRFVGVEGAVEVDTWEMVAWWMMG